MAPQVTAFPRGDSGVRAGATALGRFDFGRNHVGFTVGWSGATAASATNPAGTMDLGVGAGRRLAAQGWLGRITPHANFVYERSTGQSPIRATFEVVEFQITDKVAVDISGQHFRTTGIVDHQFLVGVTVNLGRWR